ncbi:putative dolichyl-diphosphooligosaccharide--protein glycosyltransferase subunit 3B [Dorcoceras hygrometricum]|nr:putative dolichyl-diphosphooligosaccharide--protein glycosyltransferase subunit 3B [Dorcoceras hygrometricum]
MWRAGVSLEETWMSQASIILEAHAGDWQLNLEQGWYHENPLSKLVFFYQSCGQRLAKEGNATIVGRAILCFFRVFDTSVLVFASFQGIPRSVDKLPNQLVTLVVLAVISPPC